MTNTPQLTVVKAGPMTLIQDFGRLGYARLGITQGGPVDDYAFSWANHLLGNGMNCSTLEITLGPAAFYAEADCHLALCGAQMTAKVDGTLIPNWSEFVLKKGQTLRLSMASNGLRAYLAVKGGFQVAPQLGSCSSVIREHLGGLDHDGASLQNGQALPFAPHTTPTGKPRSVTFRFTPDYNLPLKLRVVEGYQASHFCHDERERFYSQQYVVDKDSNRMGYRLQGDAIAPPCGGIISEGIALGAIQIPPDGQPIILLNDRQTIGGYPKLGCVARIDLPRLAQAKPGQRVEFVRGDRAGLQDVWCQWANFFRY